ncbi:MAG TPA: peptidylprolyl isomerase [Alphaproteobacteria bacterium]|nr:peptidylprolyl isomerase [Alphaproteobacteria bacterium]
MALMLKRFLIALALFPLLALPTEGRAQQPVERIAAVVNDQVISLSDLVARLRLALLSSGLQPTDENQQRLLPQVLRGLIDEYLQRQEASRLNIRATDEQIENAIGTIAAQNNLPPDQLLLLLQRNNIPVSTLREQVATQIAWGELVQRQLLPHVNIGDQEIDETLNRIVAERGRPEYLVAEIFLGVDDPDRETEVRQLADSLVQQIRQGAPFAGVARQFSQAAGAASGGDLGWVVEGQLDPALDQALQRLAPGQVSDPVRTLTGYHIMLLRDQRRALQGDPGGAVITLHQIGLPFPSGDDSEAAGRQLAAQLREATADISGCEAFDRTAAAMGVGDGVDAGTGQMEELPPPLQAIVANLPTGEPSEPQMLADGVAVYMVCERQEASPTASPNREDIARSLRMQRLDLLQRRYLRDLRAAAFIDIRV